MVSCVPETLQERSLKLLLVLVICFSFCPLLLVKAFSLSLELSPAFFTRSPCGSGRADNTFPSHLMLGVGICLRCGHLESTIPVHTLIISEMGYWYHTFALKLVLIFPARLQGPQEQSFNPALPARWIYKIGRAHV